MADKKISQLDTLATVADDDYLVVVDISDTTQSVTGTTKKAVKTELKGDKGETGAAATVDVGTTTTGNAGTDASVTNSGTTSAAILDFIIPRGDKGETGDTGPQGIQGIQGIQGETGATGADGDDAYVYIAYASDASGTGFTMTFDANLDYIAVKNTTTPIASPSASDFTGLWKNYKGATGATGDTGPAGADGVVQAVVAGTNISVDNTDPANPVVTNTQDISGKLDTTLNSSNIFVGNGSNVATGVALSGDASLDNTGLLSVHDTRLTVRNETGSTIAAGKAVYISGFNDVPLISLCDNTVAGKELVMGVVEVAINDQSNGYIKTNGTVSMDTNAMSAVGARVYLSTSGTLTTTKPTSGNCSIVGTVTIKDNAGQIELTKRVLSSDVCAAASTDVMIRMGDSAGSNKTSFRDYANTEVASIDSDGNITSAGVSVPTISSTSTLTNKRINPRLVTAASYTTDTGTSLDVSTCDQFEITAQAGDLKFNNPGGTPLGGQGLVIRIKDNGTARALTYDTQFRAIGVTLPTTTVVSKTLYMGFIYNATDTKWDCVAVVQEA